MQIAAAIFNTMHRADCRGMYLKGTSYMHTIGHPSAIALIFETICVFQSKPLLISLGRSCLQDLLASFCKDEHFRVSGLAVVQVVS